ncbi:NAD(P)/FAD-dependent oxidoreductase [Acuticoccus sp.]|uniref:NAD(P)/FAD-dependent oxidoreductase n=1 Tax=Acuticoccus sp. TaxID=1904378 RepID=UPI003B51E772
MIDVVVVGGGIAGAATAIGLARDGVRTVVLERQRSPGAKVCGEFLSGVALAELATLGTPARALGAVPLAKVAVAATGVAAQIGLPFAAASLTRHRLDEALLACAEAHGATVVRGVTVRRVARCGAAWRVNASCGRAWQARRVVVASGKSDVPGRPRGAGLHGSLVGLKLYAEPSPSARALLGEAVHLALFPGGYCGLQPVEDGRMNVCLVVEGSRLRALGRPEHVFQAVRRACPHADALLSGARIDDGRPLAVARLPYGAVRRATDGPIYVGDQAAVIPSFCGEGMAIALVSARVAAGALLAGTSSAEVQRRLASRFGPRVRAAGLTSRLAVAPPAQRLAATLARAAPALLRAVAAATRSPA